MIDYYNTLIERCKREDTKPLMIKCLDKATIDYKKSENDDFIDALKVVGFLVVVVFIGTWIVSKIFK